jgi:hypothetical protein
MTTSLVSQTDLESAFTAERVAEVFSVQAADGSTTGVADATSLAYSIRMGSAEAARLLIGAGYDVEAMDATTCPDTIKQLVLPLVMHNGMRRRPEYMGKPIADVPYHEEWKQARADLKDLREAKQRVSAATPPANVGGQVRTNAYTTVQPFTFLGDPRTGTGGFNDGGF